MLNLLMCSVALLAYVVVVWYATPRFWRINAVKLFVLCMCLLALFSNGLDEYRAEQARQNATVIMLSNR